MTDGANSFNIAINMQMLLILLTNAIHILFSISKHMSPVGKAPARLHLS